MGLPVPMSTSVLPVQMIAVQTPAAQILPPDLRVHAIQATPVMVDLVPISTSAQPETITVHRLAPLAQILLGLTLVPVMRVGLVMGIPVLISTNVVSLSTHMIVPEVT